MKRQFLFLTLILALVLVACAGQGTTETEAPPEPTAAPEEPTAAPVAEETEAVGEMASADAEALMASTWQWVAFTNPADQFDIEDPENYTLIFMDDGTVNIKADCNNAIGSYTVDGSSITIELGPMTMAACPEGSLSDSFVAYLGSAAIFFFEDEHLFIDLMADGGTMEFAPGTMAEMEIEDSETGISLVSHTWELDSYVLEDGATIIDNPENYTLTFNADGTVAIKADCNDAIGSYTDDGSSLSIEVGPTTLAACPEGSNSEQFISLLGSTGNYVITQGYLLVGLDPDAGIMNFELQQVISEEFDPDAEPIFGTLTMGTENNLFIDPLLISMSSGLVEGYGVDATALGPGCTGTIPSRPDVVFNWPAREDIDTLRVFFLSTGDPTMVLVTPSGELLCNDDFNPLMLDPFIEIKDPQPGRYAAFVGHFEQDMEEPGFLVVTTQDLNPATLDIAQLLPREVDPRATSETQSLDVLEIDSDAAVLPPNGTLSPADLAYQQELAGGGEIGAFNLDHENHLCTGFIDAAPTFRFDWSGELEQLVLFFESDVDTTLKVLAPDGTFHCDDDLHGSQNLNPWLSLIPLEGTYNVWVGSFAPDVMAGGTLTITGDAEATPVPLTSQDIQ